MTSKEYLKQYYRDNRDKALANAKAKRDLRGTAINNGTFTMPGMKEKTCANYKKILSISIFGFHWSNIQFW